MTAALNAPSGGIESDAYRAFLRSMRSGEINAEFAEVRKKNAAEANKKG